MNNATHIPVITHCKLTKGDVLSFKINMKLKCTFLDLSMINNWFMLFQRRKKKIFMHLADMYS